MECRERAAVAFGQAVACRLFSTKCYVVMPTTISDEDQSRLEALCMLFGVGLVVFDVDPKAANYSVRVRADRDEELLAVDVRPPDLVK